jgi:hypothetical protein
MKPLLDRLNVLDKNCSHTESQFLELLSDKTTDDEVDRQRTITRCLSPLLPETSQKASSNQ